ncbi:MAG: hypothetical protein ABF296_07210, partial [Oceanococcaceae bacterium]
MSAAVCAARRASSHRCRLGALLAAGLLASCAGTGVAPVVDPAPAVCATPPALSARGSARPIPGFPGLATQRFLGDVLADSANWEVAQWQAWLARARALALADGTSQAGMPVDDACVRFWLAQNSPRQRRLLRAGAMVESEYSTAQRALGAYPLTAIGLRMGISLYQRDTLRQWREAAQRDDPASGLRGDLQRFVIADAPAGTAPNITAAQLAAAPRDALGIPVISAPLAAQLAAAFAPQWAMAVAGTADRPGRPRLTPQLGVDSSRPILSWRVDFTRVHDQILPQISWVLWFDGRPPQGALDSYAGALDGVVWRTTFAADGWPRIHDTIHACGCYHMVFPVRHAPLAVAEGLYEERRLQPGGRVGAAALALLIDSTTHYVRAVVPADAAQDYPA